MLQYFSNLRHDSAPPDPFLQDVKMTNNVDSPDTLQVLVLELALLL